MEFTKEIKAYLWRPAMDGDLECLEFSFNEENTNVELIDISHQELVLYLENKLSGDRKRIVKKAIQHPFYQDVIAGMQMMITEDFEKIETYKDVENHLNSMQERSFEALYDL